MNINTEFNFKKGTEGWDESFGIASVRLDIIHIMLLEELDKFKLKNERLTPEVVLIAVGAVVNKLLLEPEVSLKEIIYISYKAGLSISAARGMSNPLSDLVEALSGLAEHSRRSGKKTDREEPNIMDGMN